MRKQHQMAFPSAAESKEKKESATSKADKDHGHNVTHHHSAENAHPHHGQRTRGGTSASSHHHDRKDSK